MSFYSKLTTGECFFLDEIKSIGLLMGQVMRAFQNRMTQLLGDIELHPGQAPILMYLIENDGPTQKQLGDNIKLKPATITIMLNRMEKAGMVERRPDLTDQRLSRVFITELGKLSYAHAKSTIKQVQQEAYKGFTQEELMLMRRLLMHILTNIEEATKENGKTVRH